jgi:hypothetical protein
LKGHSFTKFNFAQPYDFWFEKKKEIPVGDLLKLAITSSSTRYLFSNIDLPGYRLEKR